MSIETIQSAIPHREPFLLIDEVVEQTGEKIVCRKTFNGDEFWYRGHYPDYPITPGVLLCESAMQAGAVMLAEHAAREPNKVPVATRLNNVQFKHAVRPGDTIRIEVQLCDRLKDAYFMNARVSVNDKVAVRCEFACTLADRETA